jgi:hypothetical protein
MIKLTHCRKTRMTRLSHVIPMTILSGLLPVLPLHAFIPSVSFPAGSQSVAHPLSADGQRLTAFPIANDITRLSSRRDAIGRTRETFTHTFDGLPASRTDARGNVTTNIWDASTRACRQSGARTSPRCGQRDKQSNRYDLARDHLHQRRWSSDFRRLRRASGAFRLQCNLHSLSPQQSARRCGHGH